MIAKTKFVSEAEKREYVYACDADFEQRLDKMMKNICDIDDIPFITLSGPTCSGKTTASKKLITEFSERGRKVKIISLDDFFRDAAALEAECKDGILDFDSEKALDLPELARFMHDIQTKGSARLPKFDFIKARRTHFEEFSIEDADTVVFEGIQAIYPEFTSLFEKGTKHKSIYISVLTDLILDGKAVSPREIRLWRRLVRDYRFRGAAPEFSFRLWEGVVANEDKNILPFANSSDFMINSLQGYEPCMLADELEKLMKMIPSKSKYYEKSLQIMQTLSEIDRISEEYLPEKSLYHEFI